MKVWITKYALTKGILESDVEATDVPGLVVNGADYSYGKEWHSTREIAVTWANKMKDVKLRSFRKSIEKLEATKFE